MTGTRVCVVVRRGRDVLAFEHPQAGLQLVKGRPEPGEGVAATARRELFEEAGIRARRLRRRGWVPQLRWHLVEAWTGRLPDRWIHRCADDGGHDFAFRWHRLGTPAHGFHTVFRRVLDRVGTWP